MVEFADDSYLIVPAANVQSCGDEIAHVENWATENNLKLNRIKSVEIAFVSPWSKRAVEIPPPAVPGVERAKSIKVLGPWKSAADSLSLSMLTICLCPVHRHCLRCEP